MSTSQVSRFTVRVDAAATADATRARAVQQVLQQACDVFISPAQFDGLGLHSKGCEVNCDGSGGIPGGLVYVREFVMQPQPVRFSRGDHVSFKVDSKHHRGTVLAVEPAGAAGSLVCGYSVGNEVLSVMCAMDEVEKVA